MTSNIGTKYLVTGTRVGFGDGKNAPPAREVEEMVLKELRREFSPEFINRIDELIVFNPLATEELRAICRLLLDDVAGDAAAPGPRARGRRDGRRLAPLDVRAGRPLRRPAAPADDPATRRGCGIGIAYRRPGAARVPRSDRDRGRPEGPGPLAGCGRSRAVGHVQAENLPAGPAAGPSGPPPSRVARAGPHSWPFLALAVLPALRGRAAAQQPPSRPPRRSLPRRRRPRPPRST